MEGKLAYFEPQNELKSRMIDDLEHYGAPRIWFRSEREQCEDVVKSYIKNSFNVDIEESGNNRVHRIGRKIKKNRKIFPQIIVKFKGYVPRTKVYMTRKQKLTSQTIRTFTIKRCLRQSQRLRKCWLCLCRYQLLALFTIEGWWLEIFQFPGRIW